MSKYNGATFIKVNDIQDGPLLEQIAIVREGKYGKPDIVFESGAMLSINATNNRVLRQAYGDNSDDWIGKEIELFLGDIEYQGRLQPAVRGRPLSPPIKKSKKQAEAPAAKLELNDGLPDWAKA